MFKKALTLHQKGQLREAASLYRRVLAQNPRNADALHLLGVVELQTSNSSAAIDLIDRAIRIKPNNAAFFNNRGNALRNLKRYDEALASYDRALAIKPDYADALNNRGNVLQDSLRFAEALAAYDRALAIHPDHAQALNNRGLTLKKMKRLDEALSGFNRALVVKPEFAEALCNRGDVLSELKRPDEAVASYSRALAIRPEDPHALNNLGLALQKLRRLDEALANYDRVLAVKPDYAEALNNRSNVLFELKRLDDALDSYDRALAIRTDFAEALCNRGDVLYELKRFEEALDSYDRALAVSPGHPFLFGRRLFCKKRICDWRGFADDFNQLAAKVDNGEKVTPLFAALSTELSAAQLRACSEPYIRETHPPSPFLPTFAGPYGHDRIRLGYFSTDFRSHPVAFLIAELFERHDRARFEVNAFSFGLAKGDAMRARLETSFDRFIEVGSYSDKDVALLARKLEIDIAVDLNGFTTGSRTGVFAMRAAPIQVNYLGYPGTMGAGYIDYLIADSTLIPEGQQQHYAEKIVYLPDTFQVNNSTRHIAAGRFGKAEYGLPAEGFVFCCFNNSYKITPAVFDVWMRLLDRIEGSVLWLYEDNAAAAKQLRMEAQARDIAPARLVFAKRVELPEHLARHRLADLFLDTLPLNAGTTASDALWAGLPVLTCLGQTFQGRIAASLLNAVGLPELITQDLDAYEALALQLATDRQKLLLLRRKLAANRLTHPLFDTARFTKHIESSYVAMWQRHRAGLAPEHIHVKAEL